MNAGGHRRADGIRRTLREAWPRPGSYMVQQVVRERRREGIVSESQPDDRRMFQQWGTVRGPGRLCCLLYDRHHKIRGEFSLHRCSPLQAFSSVPDMSEALRLFAE